MPDPISALNELILPAATARFVLLANHVLASAPAATQRMAAHAGRVVQLEADGWALPVLPPPPPLLLRITPAGLFEQPEAVLPAPVADLRLVLDGSQPLESARRLAVGELPPVRIEGDANLAADMSWLLAHVRWDIAADLQRVFGPAVAEGMSRASETAMAAMRGVMASVAGNFRKP